MGWNSYRFLTMTTALRVDNVSKLYRIYDRPTDRLKEMLTQGLIKRHREFWALKHISFQIEAGTTTGIIGPNGSGKSTLLQIVTGTLEPTHGSIDLEGRVSALLELGAGFNPEFTGIENVYLNASLLGFSKNETRARLPEIERFAEIGPFIHQPVKTYSSGMYVRLAFAVAVSGDPQLLIIDEALAVGDAVFQHRCMRRLKEMQENNVTILFVSHDPAAIRYLCSRAILLNAGQIAADGAPLDVLNRYQKLIMEREEAFEAAQPDSGNGAGRDENTYAPLSCAFRHGDGSAEVISLDLLDAAYSRVEIVETGVPVTLRMRVLFHRDITDPVFGFLVRNRHGVHVYGTNTEQQQQSLGAVSRGEIIEVSFSFDCWLASDTYSISCAVHSSAIYEEGVGFDWLDGALFFRVTSSLLIEGLVNLNATATTRRIHAGGGAKPQLDKGHHG
jgi:ABC-type polysaccharide/polyol phosphate transport system ATPase subunit